MVLTNNIYLQEKKKKKESRFTKISLKPITWQRTYIYHISCQAGLYYKACSWINKDMSCNNWTRDIEYMKLYLNVFCFLFLLQNSSTKVEQLAQRILGCFWSALGWFHQTRLFYQDICLTTFQNSYSTYCDTFRMWWCVYAKAHIMITINDH